MSILDVGGWPFGPFEVDNAKIHAFCWIQFVIWGLVNDGYPVLGDFEHHCQISVGDCIPIESA